MTREGRNFVTRLDKDACLKRCFHLFLSARTKGDGDGQKFRSGLSRRVIAPKKKEVEIIRDSASSSKLSSKQM